MISLSDDFLHTLGPTHPLVGEWSAMAENI